MIHVHINEAAERFARLLQRPQKLASEASYTANRSVTIRQSKTSDVARTKACCNARQFSVLEETGAHCRCADLTHFIACHKAKTGLYNAPKDMTWTVEYLLTLP